MLEGSVIAVEKLFKAEREKAKLLEGRLAETVKQLAATRTSLLDSAAEIESLRSKLCMATQEGMSLSS